MVGLHFFEGCFESRNLTCDTNQQNLAVTRIPGTGVLIALSPEFTVLTNFPQRLFIQRGAHVDSSSFVSDQKPLGIGSGRDFQGACQAHLSHRLRCYRKVGGCRRYSAKPVSWADPERMSAGLKREPKGISVSF